MVGWVLEVAAAAVAVDDVTQGLMDAGAVVVAAALDFQVVERWQTTEYRSTESTPLLAHQES